ncbi:hypothetical protein ACQP1P_11330 [Dactylosporangium sp. CA-052675]|uniref:hypothetical protein n=1 Tax=Dactylosporangium sp. CA-052675 TaxID=3239927 RepID=UPI003D8B488F
MATGDQSNQGLSGVDALHTFSSPERATARRRPKSPTEWERHVKIKVKKVEPIEATRIHLDPDAPQGAA